VDDFRHRVDLLQRLRVFRFRMSYNYLIHGALPLWSENVKARAHGLPAREKKIPFNINGFFLPVNSQIFFKKVWTHANDNDYYCHAFRGNPNGSS